MILRIAGVALFEVQMDIRPQLMISKVKKKHKLISRTVNDVA